MVVINIDTSKDSPEEIRKTIRYLQTIVGDDTGTNNSSASSGVGGGLFGMFENDTGSEGTSDTPSGETPGFVNPFATDHSENSTTTVDEQTDAETLLQNVDSSVFDAEEGDDDLDVVEDDSDAFIEIVEIDE